MAQAAKEMRRRRDHLDRALPSAFSKVGSASQAPVVFLSAFMVVLDKMESFSLGRYAHRRHVVGMFGRRTYSFAVRGGSSDKAVSARPMKPIKSHFNLA